MLRLVAVGVLALSLLGTLSTATATAHHDPGSLPTIPTPPFVGALPIDSATPASGRTLNVNIGTTPSNICVVDQPTCPASTTVARVTMTAYAGGSPQANWPSVQVAFVVETTAYDGVYYHDFLTPGFDKCADGQNGTGVLCEESNGVPFFMANAGLVAEAIQNANPRTNVTFGLVDFFATDSGDWSDGVGDGSKYHVDVSQFVPASQFGAAVTQNFLDQQFQGQPYGEIGLDDNFLHSPSITALYGTIIGSGLDWFNNTHHVIVLIGSTAPRDPSYREYYGVSPSYFLQDPQFERRPYGWTCELAYSFIGGSSPNCEGWVRPQDGDPQHSIAALAHNAPTCRGSVGGVCTIDVVDLWTTPTDPFSPGWPAWVKGGGPGSEMVLTNTNHVLEAGCDLAIATGGSWDGPSYFSCPNGMQGSLQYVPHGPIFTPNTENPFLMRSLTRIAFGPVFATLTANHTDAPLFQFVPYGAIQVAPQPQFAAACSHPDGTFQPDCQLIPSIRHFVGVTAYGWNWSANSSQNRMYLGDRWTATFNVIVVGPPYALIPVDACYTDVCRQSGSNSVNGFYTWTEYIPPSNGSSVRLSFPFVGLTVITLPPPPVHSVPPPPLPTIPPVLPVIVAPPTVPVVPPFAAVGNSPVANISLQATAAGFLGAGFTQISLRNRPIGQRVAAMAGPGAAKKAARAKKRPRNVRPVGRFQ